ncbi:type I-Fv CRISPR-associated protein Cas5fv [Utexia brackfieldae]|uniref:type I-Fv CRISPR-associated protein Cas5fv n=1 Tax=Utexia brackfieldae TaxID=3074108 RepID=UPI00370D2A53
MRIIIAYEASWQNRFLDGSNNSPIPKTGRKFIASASALSKDANNYKSCRISKDTVMGILNRLIGDQRKLYQSRADVNYYFKEIEPLITDSDIIDKIENINHEVVYLRNIDNEDPNAFEGLIKADHPAFTSAFTKPLWYILFLTPEEVVQFILDPGYNMPEKALSLEPITIVQQIAQLKKIKNLAALDPAALDVAMRVIAHEFADAVLPEPAKPMTLFFSALYLQAKRLAQSFDLSAVQTKQKKLPGIAITGSFTEKDFWKVFSTGGKKRVLGNPYLLTKTQKGGGKMISMLQKADGRLTIHLNISPQQAQDLQQKIENAGVSSFYVGKKGLAYVIDIK